MDTKLWIVAMQKLKEMFWSITSRDIVATEGYFHRTTEK